MQMLHNIPDLSTVTGQPEIAIDLDVMSDTLTVIARKLRKAGFHPDTRLWIERSGTPVFRKPQRLGFWASAVVEESNDSMFMRVRPERCPNP